MKITKLETEIEIPQGCTFSKLAKEISVKGEKGEIKRLVLDKDLTIESKDNVVKLSYKKIGKKQKAYLFTTAAHIKNMLKGVTEGYNYKLKICSGHFPMNVSIKGDAVEVKNFIGEKVPRLQKFPAEVKVKINGDIIEIDGIDKEAVGQTAASIEKMTKRPGFDKRIFQDGIYIIEKAGKKI